MDRAVKVATAFLMAAFLVKPAHSTEITFGVVPQQAAAKLARLWAPAIEEIQKARSGREHRLEPRPIYRHSKNE